MSGIHELKLHQMFRSHLWKRGDQMKTGFIGAGKAGTTLGKYLSENGTDILGYYSKHKEHADESARFTGSGSFLCLEDIVKASDILFLTVTDDEIKNVWDHIAKMDIRGKTICHISGSLSSEVFSGHENTGAYICSVHPAYAFSDRFSSYKNFKGTVITLEGDEEAVKQVTGIFRPLGHRCVSIPENKKVLYHTACVFASNLVTALIKESQDLLEMCGFDEETALLLMSGLSPKSLSAVLERGCAAALTGPVERNDSGTVEKHEKALISLDEKKYAETYNVLSGVLADIAAEKHPDRDMSEIRNLLKL